MSLARLPGSDSGAGSWSLSPLLSLRSGLCGGVERATPAQHHQQATARRRSDKTRSCRPLAPTETTRSHPEQLLQHHRGHCPPVPTVWPRRPDRRHRTRAPPSARRSRRDWQHCANELCEVIFHLGSDTVETDSVSTQVGLKATDKVTPVCFCFAHTADDLAEDFVANDGVSQIKASIKVAVADSQCACEHLNPSGKCCLVDVRRTLKNFARPTPVS